MASQVDVQDLLRLLTTGRNKIPMLQAMTRATALKTVNLRSITEIATASLETIESALGDAKAAKSLQTACKALVKDPSKKRTASSDISSSPKRVKSAYELAQEPQTPQEIEKQLELPQPSEDEERIEKCIINTNRAPLVVAFAVRLLKWTMPEQPISSRLSLAQAVCSINSKSKAVSLGIEGKQEEVIGKGQPKVKVMGRDIHVLKRGGYDWKSEDKEGENKFEKPEGKTWTIFKKPEQSAEWIVSSPVTSKQSTFIARALPVTTPTQARSEIQKLLAANPDLREASHNITAWRVVGDQGGVIEDHNDDGETGGGRHLLGVMQSSDVVGMLLIITRWYGGIMLGTDRWRIMTQVSRDALSQRLRITGSISSEALWGLDLSSTDSSGLGYHRPEAARAYIMKSFASSSQPPPTTPTSPSEVKEKEKPKKRTAAQASQEKLDNLGLLLGALDILFGSWAPHVSKEELDRKAWGWYVQVRPDVASGVAGWGGKADVKLADILKLRRAA